MKSKNFILAVMLGSALVACDDVFEPAIENTMDITSIHSDPSMAMGLLGNAYVLLPYDGTPNTDLATDDAVSNIASNSYRQMAGGSWTSNSNPVSRWRNCYHAIQYVNLLLEQCDDVAWASTPTLNTLFNDQMKGSCYAMRGMYHFYLLQVHAGYVGSTLMGVPYHTASEDATSNFNQARLTYAQTIAKINEDFDMALSLLPDHFGDINSEDQVPAKYKSIGATMSEYNRAFGSHHKGKIDAAIIGAIRAQMDLMSASPAYAESGVTYAQAAKSLADVLKSTVGGIAGLDPTGHTWFANTADIDKLASDANPKEILWRSGNAQNNDIEMDNFPPSLFGKGRVNPTQNLVDAYPMANGYPITDAKSGYDPKNPYVGRDPRFYAAILYNGAKQGVQDTEIDMTVNSTTKDGLNKENEYSTRTGYYLRKLTRADVNCNSSNATTQKRYTPRIRFTELFLGYAEAANEAYGPTADGGNGMSAYDVIKAIRNRALGIENDEYLESIKDNKDAMRELIRNERRLEFAFENKRFWDLRRWKVDLSKLNEPARGVKITAANGEYTYEYFDVDSRDFADYQYYGPIPYGECQKFSALEQNQGW
ncbi:MAG: RagB/SusD family nutrient uptake outer membrane protein [Bacteroidales bacterium]|nr:RagB/SusD family nutrient uptake outer membrane protein [Bacteroidales bacterium]